MQQSVIILGTELWLLKYSHSLSVSFHSTQLTCYWQARLLSPTCTKGMCLETKPATSGSTTVTSSALLLWPGAAWRVARGLSRSKAGGISLSPGVRAYIAAKMGITYVQAQHCTSLFHLSTRHCGVSDAGSDYLWGHNGPVRVCEINEACSCGCTCSFSVILLSPGYSRVS